jgi:hypothetical protein
LTTTNGALLQQVRDAIGHAHQLGQVPPGRPTLRKLTGATDHAIRKALAQLASDSDSDSSPATDAKPIASAGDHHQRHAAPGDSGNPPATTSVTQIPIGGNASHQPDHQPDVASTANTGGSHPTSFAGDSVRGAPPILADVSDASPPTAAITPEPNHQATLTTSDSVASCHHSPIVTSPGEPTTAPRASRAGARPPAASSVAGAGDAHHHRPPTTAGDTASHRTGEPRPPTTATTSTGSASRYATNLANPPNRTATLDNPHQNGPTVAGENTSQPSPPATSAGDTTSPPVHDHHPGDASPPAENHHPDNANPAPPAGGKLVAWIGFIFGSATSIAANVLHTWLPTPDQPPGSTPSIASQLGAAVWPIALLLAVEVLSRVNWPHNWTWTLARYGGTGTVALGSAVISYSHVQDLLHAWHYNTLSAAVGPLVLDGLMTISGLALLTTTHTPQPPNTTT